MLKIENANGAHQITLGVECKANPELALDKPLTLHFSEKDIRNLAQLEAKIKFLQRAYNLMLPAKKLGLVREVEATEAFETSKYEGVFKDAVEPDAQLQRQIVHTPDFETKESAYLLMRNTAESRRHALTSAYGKMSEDKPLFTAADPIRMQGIIYHGYNELKNLRRLEHGYVDTGTLKTAMNGDKDFRTAHPDVTQDFMRDWGDLLASDLRNSLHPIILGFVASFAFVQIHPVEDGNGRVSRQILETIICCSQSGEFDLRNMVAVSNSGYKPDMNAIFRHTKPDSSGNINLAHFLGVVGGLLEQSIDAALTRMNVKMPEVGR